MDAKHPSLRPGGWVAGRSEKENSRPGTERPKRYRLRPVDRRRRCPAGGRVGAVEAGYGSSGPNRRHADRRVPGRRPRQGDHRSVGHRPAVPKSVGTRRADRRGAATGDLGIVEDAQPAGRGDLRGRGGRPSGRLPAVGRLPSLQGWIGLRQSPLAQRRRHARLPRQRLPGRPAQGDHQRLSPHFSR